MEDKKPYVVHTFYDLESISPTKTRMFFVATERTGRVIRDDVYSGVIDAMAGNGCKYPTEGITEIEGPEVFLVVNITDADWIKKNATPKFVGIDPSEVYLIYEFDHQKLEHYAAETRNGKMLVLIQGCFTHEIYGDGRWLAKILQDLVVDTLPSFTLLPEPLKLVS